MCTLERRAGDQFREQAERFDAQRFSLNRDVTAIVGVAGSIDLVVSSTGSMNGLSLHTRKKRSL